VTGMRATPAERPPPGSAGRALYLSLRQTQAKPVKKVGPVRRSLDVMAVGCLSRRP